MMEKAWAEMTATEWEVVCEKIRTRKLTDHDWSVFARQVGVNAEKGPATKAIVSAFFCMVEGIYSTDEPTEEDLDHSFRLIAKTLHRRLATMEEMSERGQFKTALRKAMIAGESKEWLERVLWLELWYALKPYPRDVVFHVMETAPSMFPQMPTPAQLVARCEEVLRTQAKDPT